MYVFVYLETRVFVVLIFDSGRLTGPVVQRQIDDGQSVAGLLKAYYSSRCWILVWFCVYILQMSSSSMNAQKVKSLFL